MIDLANHILINAVVYIDNYSKKEKLNDYQKGILHGIWMCVDSIKNQLEIENETIDIDIDKIMSELENLYNN